MRSVINPTNIITKGVPYNDMVEVAFSGAGVSSIEYPNYIRVSTASGNVISVAGLFLVELGGSSVIGALSGDQGASSFNGFAGNAHDFVDIELTDSDTVSSIVIKNLFVNTGSFNVHYGTKRPDNPLRAHYRRR